MVSGVSTRQRIKLHYYHALHICPLPPSNFSIRPEGIKQSLSPPCGFSIVIMQLLIQRKWLEGVVEKEMPPTSVAWVHNT